MRIPRIARRDALYDASLYAQTSETNGEAIIDQIDFTDVVGVNSTKAIAYIAHVNIQGFGEFKFGFSENANLPNFS